MFEVKYLGNMYGVRLRDESVKNEERCCESDANVLPRTDGEILNWFGHAGRKNGERLVKKGIRKGVNEKSSNGSTTKKVNDCLEKKKKKGVLDVEQVERMVHDRNNKKYILCVCVYMSILWSKELNAWLQNRL